MYTEVKGVLMGKYSGIIGIARRVSHIALPAVMLALTMVRISSGAAATSNVVSTIGGAQHMLMQIGPALSTVLFILAGVFYALGQLMPPDKKAQFHTTAVNIIIGAIVVAALSFASASLTSVSSNLLNISTNATSTVPAN